MLVLAAISARVCSEGNIADAGIEIDDRPEHERFARAR
jgi:hypothetical protein